MSPTRPALLWSALAVVYVVWGSTYLAIRIVAESLPGFGAPAARFGLAGVILAAGLVVVRGPRVLNVTWRQLGGAALVGTLLLAGGNGLVVLAESPGYAVPSGVASLVIALIPLLLVLFRVFTGDRPSGATVAGLLLGFAGLAFLYVPGSAGGRAIPLVGGLVLLGAALTWATGSFVSRLVALPPNPFVGTVYQMLAGAAAMSVIAVLRGEPAPWRVPAVPVGAWVALGYLIVFGSLVAFSAYVWLLQRAPISLVSTYAYVNPVVALGLGAAVLAEPLSGRVLVAAGTVIAGVVLVVSTERPHRVLPEPLKSPEPLNSPEPLDSTVDDED